MHLKYHNTFSFIPKTPFHFDGTFHKPSHFLNKLRLEDWKPDKYWQAFRFNKRIYGLKVENKGAINSPKLRISFYSDKSLKGEELKTLIKEVVYRFELDLDLEEFNGLAKKDKRFYPIFKKWMGMRNTGEYTLYELLIIGILLQNATVCRSQQMLDALLGKYGKKVIFDYKEFWTFWLPENLRNVQEQELRELKIGYRAKFIKKLSQDFAEGKVDELKLRNLDKEEVKKELIKLYGVGPETARILLFENFHQFDTFDHIAPWQQKIYSQLFYKKKLVPVEKIQKDITRQYGKYSMLAVHYIWEDIFWRRKNERIPWLKKEIRL